MRWLLSWLETVLPWYDLHNQHSSPATRTPLLGQDLHRVRPETPMIHHSAALMLVTTGLIGCAAPVFPSRETGVASVQAVYVEVASDIYVSERLLAAPPAQDYWVKLTLPDEQGQNITTMAQVPARLVLTSGDTVSVALEPLPGHNDTVTVKRPNRVLDVISTRALAQANSAPLPPSIARFLAPTNP